MKRCENAGADGGVVARAVMVELRQTQSIGDNIELEFLELLQKCLRNGERIDVHGVERKAAALCRGGNEADIKGGVVRHERKIARKFQNLVEDGVRNLIRHLVGMSFRDRL